MENKIEDKLENIKDTEETNQIVKELPQELKNQISYYAAWSVYKKLYRAKKYPFETLERANEITAKQYNCIFISLLEN